MEVIVRPATVVPPVTAVRGTLLVSSLAALRKAELFDRYSEFLANEVRHDVLFAVATTWVPVGCAWEHYRACDKLGLSSKEVVSLGEHVGSRIQGPFMQALFRTARHLGVTQWALLGRADKLWGRLMQGGSVAVERLGESEAVVELLRLPLVEHQYFRQAFIGVINVGFQIIGVKKYAVRIDNVDYAAQRCRYHLTWV